jgi:hypothetical protein
MIVFYKKYVREVIRAFDLFEEPVVQLNMRGKTSFKSTFGGLVGITIWGCLLAFLYTRTVKMLTRDSPIIY